MIFGNYFLHGLCNCPSNFLVRKVGCITFKNLRNDSQGYKTQSQQERAFKVTSPEHYYMLMLSKIYMRKGTSNTKLWQLSLENSLRYKVANKEYCFAKRNFIHRFNKWLYGQELQLRNENYIIKCHRQWYQDNMV
jgi:hypothetical protein